jgi:hypothetical protein
VHKKPQTCPANLGCSAATAIPNHHPHPCCRALPSGVTQIDRVVEAVETTLSGSRVVLLAKKALPALDLPKVCGWGCVKVWFFFGGGGCEGREGAGGWKPRGGSGVCGGGGGEELSDCADQVLLPEQA